MAIADAYVRIKPDMRGIHKETKKGLLGAEKEFDASGKRGGGRLSSAFGSVAKAGVVAAGTAAAAAMGSALVKGFGRLTAIDNAEQKLLGLGHSAQSVEKIMGNALASVKGTAFGLEEAATVAAGLVASGIKPGQELEQTLKTVADSATIAGIGMDEMGAIFGKVAAAGKLQGDELNQLAERGVPALQLLSEHLGVSVEETRKMVSAGKVSFQDFAAAMDAGMGGAALKSGETFTGAWKNVGAALGRIGATILEPFFNAAKPAMGLLTSFLDRLNDGLRGVMEILFNGNFSDGFRDAFGIEEDHPLVGFLFGVRETAMNLGPILGQAFAPLWQALQPLIPALFQAWQNLSPIGILLKALAPVASQLGGAIGTLAATLAGALGQTLAFLLPIVSQLATIIAGVLAEAFRAIVPIISQLAQMLGPILGVILRALAPIITVVVQVVGSLLQALSPILGIVGNLITALLPPLMRLFQALAPVIQLVGTIVAFLAQVVGVILVAAIKLLMPIINVLVQVLSVVLVAAINIVIGIINGLVWVVRNVLGPVFTWLYNAIIKPVWNAIVAVIRWAWNNVIKPIWAAISWYINNILAPVFRLLLTVIQYVWQRINAAISQAWAWIRANVFVPLNNWIRNTLGPVFSWFRDRVVNVWNQIRADIDRVWAWIRTNVFAPLEHAVRRSLPDAFEKGKDAIGKAWDKLRALARKPVAFVVETIMRDGLVKPFNKVADFFKADKINEKFFTVPKLYTGGPVPGWSPSPTADNIPIWATAGEFMVRHSATQRMNREHPGVLDHINRYGTIPQVFGYAKGGLVALGNALKKVGVRVAGHNAFPPVGRHSTNSEHYNDRAIDLNYGPGGQNAIETAFFDRLAPILHQLGWGVIWKWDGHFGHLHVGTNQKSLGNWNRNAPAGVLAGGLAKALEGLGNIAGGAANALVDLNPFKGLVDKIKNGVGGSPFAQMIGSGATGLVNKAVDWMQARMPFAGDHGATDPGAQSGVQQWAGLVREALAHVGQPTSDSMVNTVLRRLKQESGGNPRAINNWDVNARRGTPSKGLMQVIDPTFRAFRDKKLGNNIWDPLQNLVASMRYALNRYGSLPAAYNRKGGYALGGEIRKYDTGGIIPPGLTTVLNATGRNEYAFRPDQLEALRAGDRPVYEIGQIVAADPDAAIRAVREDVRRREALYA